MDAEQADFRPVEVCNKGFVVWCLGHSECRRRQSLRCSAIKYRRRHSYFRARAQRLWVSVREGCAAYRIFPKRPMSRFRRQFELLLVVGAIVTLTAVMAPKALEFIDKADSGAQAAEANIVQLAIELYMATQDPPITFLPYGDYTSKGVHKSTNSFNGHVGSIDLSYILRNKNTNFFYCWRPSGSVTRQDTVATVC